MNPNPCAGPLPFRGWLCAAIFALAATGAPGAAPIDFNRDIRPILSCVERAHLTFLQPNSGISLAPGFSRVSEGERRRNRLSGFPAEENR